MSERLDDVARSLATAMPRRRAVRMLGGALVSIAVPGIAARKARAASSFHDCVPKGGLLCECNCKGEVCQRICCTPKEDYECFCGPVEYGAACKEKKCPASRKCGAKCCGDGEKCVNPTTGLCCKNNETPCAILPAPGSGQKGNVVKCCARDQVCLANDKRASCCEPGDKPCDGRCCPREKQCVNKECRCPKGSKTCGPRDCCKKGEHCSKGKCCPKGKVNCGGKGKCCDEIDCCGGTCCEGETLCANGTCCPPARAFGSGKGARCCPPGTVATRSGTSFTCCPPGNPDCCGELPCLPPTICIQGTCKRV